MSSELERILESLDLEERAVFEYFKKNLSVGEILAVKELKLIYRINDPLKVIDSLIKKNILEKGAGCINLSNSVRELLKKRKER
ncbi:MAG TPA: hypothetical protein VNL13_06095 [Sulfolobales archaeon]|nr:hypothetical protein [Sulfolobales archaeon]